MDGAALYNTYQTKVLVLVNLTSVSAVRIEDLI